MNLINWNTLGKILYPNKSSELKLIKLEIYAYIYILRKCKNIHIPFL